MIPSDLSPVHALPSGLCEDPTGEAAALISRMGQGDGTALREIHAMWSPVFLGIATRMLGEPKEASKALKSAFIRIWQRSSGYDPHQSPPFVWAFTILRETCIARLGKQRRPAGNPDLSRPPDLSEDSRVMPLDDWRRLRAALDSLSPEERACLETAVFLGYAHTHASRVPDSKSLTVKACLRRALDKIRNQLSRYEL